MKVELPDYKKIASQIEKKKIEISEKEIEESLLWLQKSWAKSTLKNQPAEKGDFVEISFSSPEIEEGKENKDAFLLGQGYLIPGFEENLVGMKENQEKEFFLKFPKNHFQKELAEKEVKFRVKMNSVKKIELPAINDDWARVLGSFPDLKSLKKSVREGIKIEKELKESERIRQEILGKIIENSNFEVPEILIEAERNRILDNLKREVQRILKIPFEDYLRKIQKSEAQLRESFLKEAQKNIRDYLVIKEIAKKEKIEISEEEINQELNKVLKNYPAEKIRKLAHLNFGKENLDELDLEKLRLYIEDEIKNERVLQSLESYTQS
jgi:trigger factor